MSMKLAFRIIITTVLLLAVVYIAIKSMKVMEVNIHGVDFTTLSDGDYRGAFITGPVSAEVLVHVASGRVVSIYIVSHETVMGRKAESIVDDVVRSQSLYVDVVSGATWSSKTILKAIEVALSRESML